MAGFQVYNAAGALTIDSEAGRAVVRSELKTIGHLSDKGYYAISSAFGNGSTLGFLQPNFLPVSGLRWFQMRTDGEYCMPGCTLFEEKNGRFMISSNTAAIQSGYLDVFDASGNLTWSAVSASSMPRVRGLFTVPASHDLSSPITLTSPFSDPWICVSQMPGAISDDGTVTGYSGVLIRRNSSTSYSLQYVSRYQNSYTAAMGNNGFSIALASFVGY
ncbi:hypothetical protein GKQ23_12995 [Erwinia sp. E602]|uniref:hypothetical protein n=1 Tax=Erwinia sp. E602 TaxID=2675378 RepID=UPI001BAB71F9|nr:hypothetical protein [Erwinia sp. E602]QUG75855.1 hypothetical protein GKQ23_12995 [Erwinia sp. E602]